MCFFRRYLLGFASPFRCRVYSRYRLGDSPPPPLSLSRLGVQRTEATFVSGHNSNNTGAQRRPPEQRVRVQHDNQCSEGEGGADGGVCVRGQEAVKNND